MAKAPKSPPPNVLPSITELGLMLGTIARQSTALEKAQPPSRAAANDEAVELLFGRLDALRNLIGTLPAKSLADCVVQIGVAGEFASGLRNEELGDRRLNAFADGLDRIMVSVLPIMAAAAGLDLNSYGFEGVTRMHGIKFPELAS